MRLPCARIAPTDIDASNGSGMTVHDIPLPPASAATSTRNPEIGAAVASLAIGIALLAAKFIAYAITDSTAIFSDALESIVNVLASALAVYSVVLAHRPADADHPYGHGKIEFVSAGFEGGMMLLAGLVIVLRAGEQLVRGNFVASTHLTTAIVLMIVAMAINGGLGLSLIHRGKSGGSIALEADGKHLLADAVTSAAVITSLMIVKITGWQRADPIVAMMIAVWIAREAWHLLRRSAAGLMDEQDVEDNRLIREILDRHVGTNGQPPLICSYHKLRHRHSGRYHWVDFHLVVPAHWNVERGHQTAGQIEHEIQSALGEGNATAHVEPCEVATCGICHASGSLSTERVAAS